MLSRTEQRRLRALADDLRMEDPRLARALLRRGFGTPARVVFAVLAVLIAIALLATGSPIACFGAVLLDAAAVGALHCLSDSD